MTRCEAPGYSGPIPSYQIESGAPWLSLDGMILAIVSPIWDARYSRYESQLRLGQKANAWGHKAAAWHIVFGRSWCYEHKRTTSHRNVALDNYPTRWLRRMTAGRVRVARIRRLLPIDNLIMSSRFRSPVEEGPCACLAPSPHDLLTCRKKPPRPLPGRNNQ